MKGRKVIDLISTGINVIGTMLSTMSSGIESFPNQKKQTNENLQSHTIDLPLGSNVNKPEIKIQELSHQDMDEEQDYAEIIFDSQKKNENQEPGFEDVPLTSLTEIMMELNKLKEENRRLSTNNNKNKVQELHQILDNALTENEELRKKIEVIENKRKDLVVENSTLKKEIDSLTIKNNELKKSRNNDKNKIKNLRKVQKNIDKEENILLLIEKNDELTIKNQHLEDEKQARKKLSLFYRGAGTEHTEGKNLVNGKIEQKLIQTSRNPLPKF